jgi:hypothetical protein
MMLIYVNNLYLEVHPELFFLNNNQPVHFLVYLTNYSLKI